MFFSLSQINQNIQAASKANVKGFLKTYYFTILKIRNDFRCLLVKKEMPAAFAVVAETMPKFVDAHAAAMGVKYDIDMI